VLAAAAPGAAAKHGTAAGMIERLNAARARAGLHPLRADRKLNAAAARHSRRQMRTGMFAHARDIGSGRSFRRVAELIARQPGWRLRPAPVASGWNHSPAHAALLRNGSFSLVGVGWARGRMGGAPTTIWTLRLGSR
jgi:uncharacterized protein YkwD